MWFINAVLWNVEDAMTELMQAGVTYEQARQSVEYVSTASAAAVVLVLMTTIGGTIMAVA